MGGRAFLKPPERRSPLLFEVVVVMDEKDYTRPAVFHLDNDSHICFHPYMSAMEMVLLQLPDDREINRKIYRGLRTVIRDIRGRNHRE